MQPASSPSLDSRAPAASTPTVLATSGRFVVRLAESGAEVAAAQSLRYHVFYEEMRALPTPEMAARRQDFDAFDDVCDHLLVIDQSRPAGESVVGTYRLIRQEVAEAKGGFYSASEYDISGLLARNPNARFLELGRSCVHPDYRTNATIQLLWRGITGYILAHNIDFMFGCGSLGGTDPDALALPLSYLHHEHLAPPELRVRAHPHLYVPMDRMPREAINPRVALRALPPLIKGYLRLGGYVGDGAVVDRQFNTTDVFILVPVSRITDRYHSHFVADGEPAAQ
jgi:putative hemolysin